MTNTAENSQQNASEKLLHLEEIHSVDARMQHFYRELIRGLSGGVRLYVVDAKSFLQSLKVLRDEVRLKELKDALGPLATYCIGGTYRSPLMGELLRKLGFDFAIKETTKGARISKIIDAVLRSQVENGRLRLVNSESPLQSLIISIDIADEREVPSVEILLEKIALFTQKIEQKIDLDIIVVDGSDFVDNVQDFLELAQATFPDLQLQGFTFP